MSNNQNPQAPDGARVVKKTLTALSDASVAFVSIVDRGANRIPFRAVKTETPENPTMNQMNLAILGQLAIKKADEQRANKAPAITAIIVKSELQPELLASVKELAAGLGLTCTHVQKSEGGATVIADAEQAEGELVSISPNLTVVMKGYSSYNAETLTEQMQARTSVQGIDTALYAFSDFVYDALYESDDAQSFKAAIQSGMAELGTFINNLVGQMPATVWKVDSLLATAKKSEPEVAAAPATEADPAAAVDPAATAEVEAAEDTDPAAADPAATAEPETGDEGTVQKSETGEANDTGLSAVEAALANMATQLSVVAGSVAALTAVVEKTETRLNDLESVKEAVQEVAVKAESLQHTLGTTVQTPTDADPERVVVKSEHRSAAIDTATDPTHKRHY